MMTASRRPRIQLIAAVSLLLAVGCEGPLGPEIDDLAGPSGSLGLTADGAAVATPFEADFFTDLAGVVVDEERCGAFPRVLNIQVGEGEGTHLGRFSVRITFCFDVTDAAEALEDGMLTEGESIPYDSGLGTFTAANGDELDIEIAGAVLPSTDPDFDFQFHDPFSFIGGTGRFEGASGEGMTDSFVDQEADRTFHDWSGVLILPRDR